MSLGPLTLTRLMPSTEVSNAQEAAGAMEPSAGLTTERADSHNRTQIKAAISRAWLKRVRHQLLRQVHGLTPYLWQDLDGSMPATCTD